MIANANKFRSIAFLITLFFCNAVLMGDMVFNNTINDIYQIYPNHAGVVNFIVSGRSVFGVLFSLLAGMLIKSSGDRSIIITGVTLTLLGTVFLLAIHNPYYMAAMRVVSGAGLAFCLVACISALNSRYMDLGQRSKMMGNFNGVQAVFGIIFSIVSGNLAAISPNLAYGIYWIYLPLLLMTIIFFSDRS